MYTSRDYGESIANNSTYNLETGDTLTIMIDIATSQCYICAVIGIGGLSQLYHSRYTLKSDCK